MPLGLLKRTAFYSLFISVWETTVKSFEHNYDWESLRGVVVNVLDYDIVVNEFELQSRYYGPLQYTRIIK